MNTIAVRPWGTFHILISNSSYWIKLLNINPLQRLSFQSHENRNECWTIVKGSGVITLDDKEFLLREEDSVFIPKGVKHRIYNISKTEPLLISEVATGVVDEEDIVRYNDDYNREVVKEG